MKLTQELFDAEKELYETFIFSKANFDSNALTLTYNNVTEPVEQLDKVLTALNFSGCVKTMLQEYFSLWVKNRYYNFPFDVVDSKQFGNMWIVGFANHNSIDPITAVNVLYTGSG